VHDSRAWFKLVPGNPDSEDEMIKNLRETVRRIEWAQANRNMAHRSGVSMASDGLNTEERQAALEFKRTEKIPRMRTEGREPLFLAKAGYLRYRKVYAGADNVLISHNSSPEPSAVARSTVVDVPEAVQG
jgi:hypothetical protein